MNFVYLDIAKMIDHSLLHPAMTALEFNVGIELAIAYDVASVCIMPYYAKNCAKMLRGTDIKTSTTIGFPHGGHTSTIKRAEAEQAIADGCEDLDTLLEVRQLGVTHCGASRTAEILDEARKRLGLPAIETTPANHGSD